MYRKNTAGQFVCFQMLLAATGAPAIGMSPTVRRCIDGTFAAGGGTVTEDTGTGAFKYAMAQADTNGNNVSLFFTASDTAGDAIPVCVNFVTTAADPTDGVRLGLTALPNAAAGASGGLPTGDNAGKVALQADQAVNASKFGGQTVTAAAGVTVPAIIASPSDVPSADANADALLDRAAGVETNRTMRQAMRLMLAALAGKLSGGATTTVTIRDTNDSINRIVATVDADGNRSSVTLNAG